MSDTLIATARTFFSEFNPQVIVEEKLRDMRAHLRCFVCLEPGSIAIEGLTPQAWMEFCLRFAGLHEKCREKAELIARGRELSGKVRDILWKKERVCVLAVSGPWYEALRAHAESVSQAFTAANIGYDAGFFFQTGPWARLEGLRHEIVLAKSLREGDWACAEVRS